MAQVINHHWSNGGGDAETPSITVLDNSHILIIANGDTESDGAPDAVSIDKYGSLETSLRQPKWKGAGEHVNARTIPYFVLPENWDTATGIPIGLGDLAKVTYKEQSLYAILADYGPKDKIGELSIAAIEALGGSPWNADKTKIISGLPHGVSYEIIPQSANLNSTINFETIQVAGLLAFGDHPQIKRAEKFLEVTWFELNRKSDGRPAITAYNAGTPIFTRILKGKSDLIEFLNLFPNASSVLVAETDKKVIPHCPDTVDPPPTPFGSSSQIAGWPREWALEICIAHALTQQDPQEWWPSSSEMTTIQPAPKEHHSGSAKEACPTAFLHRQRAKRCEETPHLRTPRNTSRNSPGARTASNPQ
ncbi:MAG: hypothetical protein ACK587_16920 [Cyanobacteriota bacterium]